MYNWGREGFATGLNWSSDTFKVVLLDLTRYTASLNGHKWLTDIPSDARIATSAALTGKTTTDGVLDADDVTIASVGGTECGALVVYQVGATEGASRLIAYIDTATNLPFTGSGSSVTIGWDTGPNRIAKL